MRRISTLLVGVLCLGIAGAEANPLLHGGFPGPVTGTAFACDGGGSGVCADFRDGQVFLQWPDQATGATGNNWRYEAVRSLSPITSGNYSGLTPFATEIPNNSGQLFGGTPTGSLAALNQTTKQNAALPMAKIPDAQAGGSALKTLATYSGVQPYTALGTATAYYGIVAVQCATSGCPNGEAGGTKSLLGSVGPIAESAATPQPIKYADSSRGVYGPINLAVNNVPVMFYAHQSGGTGAYLGGADNGDWFETFLPADSAWQDGRQTTAQVLLDHSQNTRQNTLVIAMPDRIWDPLATGFMETNWQGQGLTPNALVGPANRKYLGTCKGVQHTLNALITRYGVDTNQLHWQGRSMGAWGGASCGMRSASPRFASVSMGIPVWRPDHQSSPYWPGQEWTSTMPFKATLGTAPSTLGLVAASILREDGTAWGGDGGYADNPAFIAANPGTDLPVALWLATTHDPYASWADQLTARAAFRSAHRPYAFVWTLGGHDTTDPIYGLVDCDQPGFDAAICYPKSKLKLNLPLLSFDNSSIDDNPGTATPVANGMFDGDWSGGVNIGFTWAFSSDTAGGVAFTVGNPWMSRSPTANPQTTLTGTIASSGGGTVTVTNGSVFQTPATAGTLFLVGGTEWLSVSSVSGNTVAFGSARGNEGTTPQAHSAGETIVQNLFKPTGPKLGPYSTMTVDITPRRLQGFHPADSTVLTCTITPFGAGSSTQNPTVTNGLFTLTGVTINSGGNTSVSCS